MRRTRCQILVGVDVPEPPPTKTLLFTLVKIRNVTYPYAFCTYLNLLLSFKLWEKIGIFIFIILIVAPATN